MKPIFQISFVKNVLPKGNFITLKMNDYTSKTLPPISPSLFLHLVAQFASFALVTQFSKVASFA